MKYLAGIALISGIIPAQLTAQDNDGLIENYIEGGYFISVETWNQMHTEILGGEFSRGYSETFANVTWTDDCIVTIDAQSIVPVLVNESEISDEEVGSYSAMVEGLREHQRLQYTFSRYFALEMLRHGCPSNFQIIQDFWVSQVIASDERTGFGIQLINERLALQE